MIRETGFIARSHQLFWCHPKCHWDGSLCEDQAVPPDIASGENTFPHRCRFHDIRFRVPGLLGMGCGYPGALRTLFFVTPRTSHSLCPSGSGHCLTTRKGMGEHFQCILRVAHLRRCEFRVLDKLVPRRQCCRIYLHKLVDFINLGRETNLRSLRLRRI